MGETPCSTSLLLIVGNESDTWKGVIETNGLSDLSSVLGLDTVCL